jgi:hypothetical protein
MATSNSTPIYTTLTDVTGDGTKSNLSRPHHMKDAGGVMLYREAIDCRFNLIFG